MSKITFAPLRFGTYEDFMKSLTELQYLKNIKGKLKQNDFYYVSAKYHFPPEFLKQGLNGLSFPNDYTISHSKWFPILYQWSVSMEKANRELILLTTRYLRARFSSMMIIVFLSLIMLDIGLYTYLFEKQNALGIFSWLLLPLFLLTLQLSWEFYVKIGETRRTLDNHIETMIEEGMKNDVKTLMGFVNKNYKMVLFAGHILASKPLTHSYFLGMTKFKKPKDMKIGKLQKFLVALHLLPKPVEIQGEETIPVFFRENPHHAYVECLSKLLGAKKLTEEEAEEQ